MTTDDATPEVVSDADLIVVGAPVLAFRLRPTSASRPPARDRRTDTARHVAPLDALMAGVRARRRGRMAAFETRFRFSPGGSIGTITHELQRAGYRSVTKGKKFLVTGKYGPLKAGELERARAWGAELVTAAQDRARS